MDLQHLMSALTKILKCCKILNDVAAATLAYKTKNIS